MALWHLCAIKICCTRLWSIVRICICECECVSRTKKCHIPLHRYAYVCVCVCVVSLPVYLRLCLRRILWHIKNPLCHPAKTLLIIRLHIGVCPEPFMAHQQCCRCQWLFYFPLLLLFLCNKALLNAAMLFILRIRLEGCAKESTGTPACMLRGLIKISSIHMRTYRTNRSRDGSIN